MTNVPLSDGFVSALDEQQIQARLHSLGIRVSDEDLAGATIVARYLLEQAGYLSGPLPLQLEPIQIQLAPVATARGLR